MSDEESTAEVSLVSLGHRLFSRVSTSASSAGVTKVLVVGVVFVLCYLTSPVRMLVSLCFVVRISAFILCTS